MGGNALTETLVFGARAGEAAANWAKDNNSQPKTEVFKEAEIEKFTFVKLTARSNPSELMANLIKIIWKEAGIIRNKRGLEFALNSVNTISSEILQSRIGNPLDVQRRIEITLGAQAASLIVQAALKRKESRGSHFREDFIKQDDDSWQGHLQVKLSRNGKTDWNFQAIS
jgi:fumarate reductase (CoM/CoB) subunit A